MTYDNRRRYDSIKSSSKDGIVYVHCEIDSHLHRLMEEDARRSGVSGTTKLNQIVHEALQIRYQAH